MLVTYDWVTQSFERLATIDCFCSGWRQQQQQNITYEFLSLFLVFDVFVGQFDAGQLGIHWSMARERAKYFAVQQQWAFEHFDVQTIIALQLKI